MNCILFVLFSSNKYCCSTNFIWTRVHFLCCKHPKNLNLTQDFHAHVSLFYKWLKWNSIWNNNVSTRLNFMTSEPKLHLNMCMILRGNTQYECGAAFVLICSQLKKENLLKKLSTMRMVGSVCVRQWTMFSLNAIAIHY